MNEKTDSPQNYHTFLFSDKVFTTPFRHGYGFLVELQCGHIVEFADTTKEEKQRKKIFCAQRKADAPTVQPKETFYKDILRYRRVKIGRE